MITILVIGAGGIGMRHMQSIASLKEPFQCWAIDPSQSALDKVKALLDTMDTAASFRYITSQNDAPEAADVCVVATSSLVRRAVTEQLLSRKTVRHLVLEKFLFPCEEDYEAIGALLRQKDVPCFVNTPRCMYPGWQMLEEAFAGFEGKLHYSLVGGSWGLACNSIHYLDILDRLLGGDAAFTYDLSALDPSLCPCKRPGYIEFSGTLRVGHPRASSIELVCERSNAMWPIQCISTDTLRFVISEPEQRAWRASLAGGWKLEELPFPIRYQSQLTATVVEELMQKGTCELTTYEHSAKLHLPLLRALLKQYNQYEGKSEKLCPIT